MPAALPVGVVQAEASARALALARSRSDVVQAPAQLRRPPARPVRILLTRLSVHEPVHDVCKKAASLWARGEMLGTTVASDALVKSPTWENGITFCA